MSGETTDNTINELKNNKQSSITGICAAITILLFLAVIVLIFFPFNKIMGSTGFIVSASVVGGCFFLSLVILYYRIHKKV